MVFEETKETQDKDLDSSYILNTASFNLTVILKIFRIYDDE